MISSGELRKGIAIELEGQLYQIIDFQHIKMGRGSAQVRLKLRDVRAGHTIERTFQAGDRFQRVYLTRRPAQYLYREGDLHHFMDTETFDQRALATDQLEGVLSYLKEGMTLELLIYGEEAIAAELPNAVELKVADTGPGVRGDTASGGSKPARLETGAILQVPFHINVGDIIKVDTRTGSYIERVG